MEDEEGCRELINDVLADHHIKPTVVGTVRQARHIISELPFDVLMTDFCLQDGDARSVIDLFKIHNPTGLILTVTGYPDHEKVKFLESRAVNHLLIKPFTCRQLTYTFFQMIEKLRSTVSQDQKGFGSNDLGIIGRSEHIKNIRQRVRRMGQGKFPVLIQGDSGTGKEVVAHALHRQSQGREHPMVIVNCAAIPKHLEEAELFGYKRGAFTGAYSSKEGLVGNANGSTLFLDEVGELSLNTQAKLLRVVDTGEYTRVGEVVARRVDIRIISATNRDLEKMVATGTFRKDLYFRIRGAVIYTEALKDRKEDIEPLAEHFLFRQNQSRKQKFDRKAVEQLLRYEWPGNVRELKNTVTQLSTYVKDDNVTAEAVRVVLKIGQECTVPSFHEAKKDFEQAYCHHLLSTCNGNIAHASRIAGLHRPSLIRKLKVLTIDPKAYRS